MILPTRVFDCVLHLVEQRSRAVGRDELIAVIWNRLDVGDNMLAQLLARTRRFFDDTGDGQRVIRTLPGYGYQWIADTQVAAATDRDEEHDVRESHSVPTLRKSRAQMVAPRREVRYASATAIALAITAGAGFYWMHRSPSDAVVPKTLVTPAVPSDAILVLPATLDAGVDDAWMRLGLMAMIVNRIERAGVRVVPVDNVVALTKGVDVAKFGASDSIALAQSVAARRVIRIHATHAAEDWSVNLALDAGGASEPLTITSVRGDAFDAAKDATDRLLTGVGAVSRDASGTDQNALTLRKAEADALDGRYEDARVRLIAARSENSDSSEVDYQIGLMDYFVGRFDDAQRELEALAVRISAQDDPVALARTYNTLANVHYQLRNFADVESYSQRAIDLLRDRPDGTHELGRAWRGRARANAVVARYDDALRDASRARIILATQSNWLGVAQTDLQIGMVLRLQGRSREALEVLGPSADQLREFHDPYNEAVARVHMTTALLDLVDVQGSLEQEARLADLQLRVQRSNFRAALNLYRVNVLVAAGHLVEAKPILDEAYRHVTSTGDRLDAYWAHAVAARYALAVEQPDVAEREAAVAIATLVDSEEDDRDVAWTFLLLARLQAAHDRAAAAKTREAFQSRLATNARGNGALYLSLMDADIAKAAGDPDKAEAAFARALPLADAAPVDLLRVAQSYVPWLLDRGESDIAGDFIGRLGNLTHRSFEGSRLEFQLYQAIGQRAPMQDALARVRSLAAERKTPEMLP